MAAPVDVHVRRTGDDYAVAMLELLPHGPAWSRDPGSTLVQTIFGLAQYYGFVDGRAADLLERESNPGTTIELLRDWERNWGLPDPCFPDATTIDERHKMLLLKMTWMGGQSRAYFESVLAWLGYGPVTIQEWAPFMAGISRVGDTRPLPVPPGLTYAIEHYRWYIGPPEMRFAWSAGVSTPSYAWFRAASGQCGVDHLLEIRIPANTQCLLDRWKPAHTELVFDFNIPSGPPIQPVVENGLQLRDGVDYVYQHDGATTILLRGPGQPLPPLPLPTDVLLLSPGNEGNDVLLRDGIGDILLIGSDELLLRAGKSRILLRGLGAISLRGS